MALDIAPGYLRYRCGPAGQAYDEPAFRHFLAIDRRRAERSAGSLLLVLVGIRRETDRFAKLSDATAAAVFASLGACVREIDFVGWYRHGCVAAAVLAQNGTPSNDICHRAFERVSQALNERLPIADMKKLRVRVVTLGEQVRR